MKRALAGTLSAAALFGCGTSPIPCEIVRAAAITVTCEDGSRAVLSGLAPGATCTVSDNGNGTKTIACSDGTTVIVGGSTTDAGAQDAGDADAGAIDAGAIDAGDVDAGDVDAAAIDAGEIDAGEIDAGTVDAGSVESVAFAAEICTPERWCWQNPIPQGNELNVAFAVGGDVWAFGDATMLRWDGTKWTGSIGVGPVATRLWGATKNDVWALVARGGMSHWDGNAWTPVAALAGVELFGLHGRAANDVWAVGAAVYHFDGTAWSLATAPHLSAPLNSVCAFPTGEALAVGPDGPALRWNGTEWLVDSVAPRGREAAGGAANDVWLVTSAGALHHFNGQAWTNTGQTFPPGPPRLFSSGPGRTFLVSGGIFRQVPGSAQLVSFGIPVVANAQVLADDGTTTWAAGKAGMLARLTGDTWQRFDHGFTSGAINGVWEETPTSIWAVTQLGEILHSDGTTWSAHSQPVTTRLAGIWGGAVGDGWISGANAVLLRREGAGWQVTSPPTTSDLEAVWGVAPNEVYVSGDALYRFDGTRWALSASESGQSHGTAGDDIWVARDSSLLHWDGASWTYLSPWGGTGFRGNFRVWAAARNLAFVSATVSGGANCAWWNGATWGSVDCYRRDIAGTSANDVWGASRYSTIDARTYLSRFGGSGFVSVTPPGQIENLERGGPAGGLWGFGAGGTIVRRKP